MLNPPDRTREILFFRILLAVWWIGFSLLFYGSLYIKDFLPEPLRAYMEGELERDQTTGENIGLSFALVLLGMMLAGIIGLFSLKNWGKHLFTWGYIFGSLSALFLGPSVEPAGFRVASDLLSVLAGIIMATAWILTSETYDYG